MTPGHCLLLPLLHQSHRLYQMTPAPCSEPLLSRPWCLPLWVLCGICPTRVCAYTGLHCYTLTLSLAINQEPCGKLTSGFLTGALLTLSFRH